MYGDYLIISVCFLLFFFFFFSSRRRHTRWNCDWSSDVCSSDLKSGDAAASPDLCRDRHGPVSFLARAEDGRSAISGCAGCSHPAARVPRLVDPSYPHARAAVDRALEPANIADLFLSLRFMLVFGRAANYIPA